MSNRNDLLLFFDRPSEPCFMQKGEERSVFTLPDHYYPEKYAGMRTTLANRFGDTARRAIPVANISLPDLSLPLELPYHSHFSFFVNKHREMAGKLIDIFMGMRNVEDLKSLCAYCQMRVNPYMFNYCLSVAIMHRPDTKGMNIPTFAETFPDKFIDPKAARKAREVAAVEESGSRMPVIIPRDYTASASEPEQRVAYFREDIGINLHHWHWHLVYPYESTDRAVVDKDRRGELFYYMHQQMIARYNIERMCNDLGIVIRYNDFRQPIAEGYFPKLNSVVASRTWPPRFANSFIYDLDRPIDRIRADISQLETWRDRFLQAIENNAILLPSGRTMTLDEQTGIDILGNVLESTTISPNRAYYGDLHNLGHVIISYAHDPDNRHLEQFSVMGDLATTMRDPVFFRWHSYIDDLFKMYKVRLPAYGTDRLEFPGVSVSSIRVDGRAGANTFGTHWEQSTLDLERGLDFSPRGPVLARFTHLQQYPFNYVIECSNSTGKNTMGTVRIFIAPRNDDKGQPLQFEEQRLLMIELDKFTQNLRPGNNTIRRNSVDSSVTVPYERTFQSQANRPGDAGSAEAAQFDFCVCGWPQHMLIPKGTAQGYPMVLFVMISNWMDDRIEQDLVGSCNDAASYCGLRDRKYPDRRSMGYPFDRVPRPGVTTLDQFLTPNMGVQECTIRFTDTTTQRASR